MKRIYNMKKTISIKQFISELGEDFSAHMKEKLLELGTRCVLTRKEDNNRLDLKHIEHHQHESAYTSDNNSKTSKKEFVYGQFVVVEGALYYSEKCTENSGAMQEPVVSSIYNELSSKNMICDSDVNSRKIDDSNIDYVIDSIMNVCPPVSQAHLDIVQGMISRSER
jgi:hypothetical protein